TRIEWWGGTVDGSGDACTENPKDFVITFYYDDNGSPGSQYQYATYTVNLNGTYTGADYGPNNVPIMHYEYTLDKAFSGLSEGWVSIQGYPAGSCEFQWLTSPNGDGKAFVDGRSQVDEDFSYGLHSDPSIPLSPWALFSGIALIAAFLGWRVIRLYR
ncbi:MAG: hypothetical protein K9H15_11670, partial [Bacteroidales bacterium]|nr:hypothetical protein [Bacteroidales bacterium]